jgi:uncharacterized repeat protein (TIGR03847 family)
MSDADLELRPVDFITVGTVGPRGKRVFHLQAAKLDQLVTLTLEKIQVSAMVEAIKELLQDLAERDPSLADESEEINLREWDTELRDPIESRFRVAQIGLGYDETSDLIVLVTQELLSEEDQEIHEPRVLRFWASRPQMRVLALYAERVVSRGRPDPQHNGRIHYYWT